MTLLSALDELDRNAMAATQGKWEPCGARFSIVSTYLNEQEILDICDTKVCDYMSVEQSIKNTRHIASANPETVRKLIATVRVMREALEYYTDHENELSPLIAQNEIEKAEEIWK